MIQYSQRDPRWRDVPLGFSLSYTIGTAGCALTSSAMICEMAQEGTTPPVLNELLKDVQGFEGALIKWEKIPDAVEGTRYDGSINWVTIPADMQRYYNELAKGPLITYVDFVPGTSVLDHHFVVALERYQDDLVIIDPWDGTRTLLMQRYAQDNWDLARSIYGIRMLRVVEQKPVVRVIAPSSVEVVVVYE